MTTPEEMADAIVDREAPTPIHWPITRRHLVAHIATLEIHRRFASQDRDRYKARAEAAERERDQWREDAKVLKDEVEVRRNAPFGIKGGACFPYCPERAARLCDCPQCQWADRIHAACLDTNRSDAIMRAGGGV